MKTKRTMSKWTGGTVLAGLSMMSLPALAQDVSSPDSGDSGTPAVQGQTAENAGESARLPITASSGLSEQFYSKIKDAASGSFSITRFNVGVKAPVRLGDDAILATSFRYGLDSYDFNSLPAGTPTPWHNINTLQLASILSWRVDDAWTAYGGAFVRMSSDSSVALGNGISGGGLMGFNYKFDDSLTLGAGLAIASQIKDHTLFLPLVTAKWKFADYWRLDVGLTDVATSGYGAEVKWLFSDNWDFGFGLQMHTSRFRIEPTTTKAVGQEKATTLYADATWHATPKIDADGFVGIATGGDIKIENNSGTQIYGHKYDAAAILGVKGSIKF